MYVTRRQFGEHVLEVITDALKNSADDIYFKENHDSFELWLVYESNASHTLRWFIHKNASKLYFDSVDYDHSTMILHSNIADKIAEICDEFVVMSKMLTQDTLAT